MHPRLLTLNHHRQPIVGAGQWWRPAMNATQRLSKACDEPVPLGDICPRKGCEHGLAVNVGEGERPRLGVRADSDRCGDERPFRP